MRDLGADVPDEAAIDRVVDLFYERVRLDGELGPVFEAAVKDWPAHLDRLKAFWSSVLRGGGRYKGDPLALHRLHAAALTDAAFSRWLALWRDTTNDLLAPEQASLLQSKAARVARSLSLALAYERGPAGREGIALGERSGRARGGETPRQRAL